MNRADLTKKCKVAASHLLQAKSYISAVDVLMAMGILTRENHERWRFRRVAHLEQVLPGSLNKFQFLLRTLRSHARDDLGLKPSRTVYTSWGKGPRQRLRFSKHGIPYLEELYSTHYVSRKLATDKPEPQEAVLVPQPEPNPPPVFNPPQP